MKHLLVVDFNSPTGRALSADIDHWFKAGAERHPAMFVENIDINHPNYLTYEKVRPDGSRRSWTIPHSSVILVVQYGKDEDPLHMGFVSSKTFRAANRASTAETD